MRGSGSTLIATHPHRRGENRERIAVAHGCIDTPPRAWGEHRPEPQHLSPQRHTPTGVGKTGLSSRGISDCRHTPTGVGRTTSRRCTRWRRATHPHGRGENVARTVQTVTHLDTPPRAWGKPQLLMKSDPDIRHTPTGVGKTPSIVLDAGVATTHPHGRGENTKSGSAAGFGGDTPPRAWGKLSREQHLGIALRHTPTGVGKTRLMSLRPSGSETHPHGRGENTALRRIGTRSCVRRNR